jgi:two-component system cell cycle sensor histidine kinase/response regulator CckA
MNTSANNRILIIDDNPAIHEDFRKILVGEVESDTSVDELLNAVLGVTSARESRSEFELDSVYQGQEGLAKVESALSEGRPYALAFVDIRMPPGWDGVETITHLWARDPALQVVICTAYSDYSWQEIVAKLGNSDRLVILKKPFDNIEVLQLAHAMTKKWNVTQQATAKFEDLDRLVRERTVELETLNRALAGEIAEREQAEAALRVSEERLARAFDACPLPTAILQVSDQRIVQVNSALVAAIGKSADAIVGAPFWSSCFEIPDEFARATGARLCRGEAIRRHECEFITANGDRRRGLLWLEPFALYSGPHVLAILQDVTEQSALEIQFRQAQKMEAVGHLAAGVAHDFNNLLTVIQGHTSMRLRSAQLDRKVADSLAAVQQAAERASSLTRQLLAFSRKQVMEKGPLCMDSVITNISAMLRRLIPESIRLHFHRPDEQFSIYGDRCNIDQILLNLVVNSRDAMPQGGDIHISTYLTEIDEDHARRQSEARVGRFACLEVRDTGEGMQKEVLSQIFEPFFTTKEAGKGSGMGLSTVHGIVKQHDGWIEVSSERGVGTTFRIQFPLCNGVIAVNTERRIPVTAPVKDRTVLLVEDDGDVRALARSVLEEASLLVIEAPDGPTALALWEVHRERIDLLITDMVMPGGLSGVDLADRISGDRPELPVIFSTGYSVNLFSGNRQFRKDVNYLPKPYLSHELTSIVSSILNSGADASHADNNGVSARTAGQEEAVA